MDLLEPSDDLKKAKSLTKKEFLRILNKYLHTSVEDLQNGDHSKKPAIDCIVIAIIGKAIREGDDKRFNFLIERLIGPMISKDPLERRKDLSPMVDHITQKSIETVKDEVENMLDQIITMRGEYVEPDVFAREK